MNPVLATMIWKNRQLRHQLYLLRARVSPGHGMICLPPSDRP
jgi:hypothetical protein